MATLNKTKKVEKVFTYEGAITTAVGAKEQLIRAVMTCMLWEDAFYEDGVSIADRIMSLIPKVKANDVYKIAIEARTKNKLRHVPLLLARVMAKLDSHKGLVGKLLPEIIQRPDELTEFLAIYWKDKKQPLSSQVKKGLAAAFAKFNEYALAKYDNDDKTVKLRDVLFLCHAKPDTGVEGFTKSARKKKKKCPQDQGSVLFDKLVKGKLETPDTWEVEISAKGNNKTSWERLLKEKKLAALALLRNLRNMTEAGVDKSLIREALFNTDYSRVLPFRFIAAAKAAPGLESEVDQAMMKCISQATKLPGKTVFVIDVSGSMYGAKVSKKSDMDRSLAASALGAIGRELCEDVAVYATAGNDSTRIHKTQLVPNRHGIALVDAIHGLSQPLGGGGIFLNQVCKYITEKEGKADRTIVITDEQDCSGNAADAPDKAKPLGRGYIINVNSYQNGIAYKTNWTHINGWSEAVLNYIRATEEYESQLQ